DGLPSGACVSEEARAGLIATGPDGVGRVSTHQIDSPVGRDRGRGIRLELSAERGPRGVPRSGRVAVHPVRIGRIAGEYVSHAAGADGDRRHSLELAARGRPSPPGLRAGVERVYVKTVRVIASH